MHAPRLEVHTADARPFLRQSRRRYDAIFLDAYRQPYIPFYLTTREFYALVANRLGPAGAFIVNVGHPPRERKLERVVSATLGAVFRNVMRDPVTDTNTLLVASQARLVPRRLRSGALAPGLVPVARREAARLAAPLAGGSVFTDDRAPVEWLIDQSFVDYAKGH
jgi:hypothetical protein